MSDIREEEKKKVITYLAPLFVLMFNEGCGSANQCMSDALKLATITNAPREKIISFMQEAINVNKNHLMTTERFIEQYEKMLVNQK